MIKAVRLLSGLVHRDLNMCMRVGRLLSRFGDVLWPNALLWCFALKMLVAAPLLRAQPLAAYWIAPPHSDSTTTGVFLFRKQLVLADVPSTFPIHVTGDNRFVLYVNGKRIGDGPARGDVPHWRYEDFDLAPDLRKGPNTIVARVWDFGSLAPIAQMSLRVGFALWSDTPSSPSLNTDAGWQVRRQVGWTFTDTGKPVGSVVGPNETIDAAQVDTLDDVDRQTADDWSSAVEIAPIALWEQDARSEEQAEWLLIPDLLPMREYTEVSTGKVVRSSVANARSFPKARITIPPHCHATILLDRRVLTTAYPVLTTSRGAGARIRLTYAEALYDDHGLKGNRNEIVGKHVDPNLIHDDFLPDGAFHHRFEPLWWRTWRYLKLEIDTQKESLDLDSLQAYYTVYPFEERAEFHSNDPVLNKIWAVGWRTVRLDAHETYMDCPYWEQLQYIADTRIEAMVTYVVSGDDRLAVQALGSFAESKGSSTLTESRYPTRELQIIPSFSLFWIGMLHDYWMYRPDHKVVQSLLPGTRSILDKFVSLQRADGLLGRLSSNGYKLWNFLDWTRGIYPIGSAPQDPNGGSVPLSLEFAIALRDAADLEEAYGDADRARDYRQNADRIAKAAYAKGWDKNRLLLRDTPFQHSFGQQTNIFGVLANAIPAQQQRSVLMRILADELKGKSAYPGSANLIPASFYFRYYLARALDHAGLDDLYLKLLEPWRTMLKLGLSTWAEEADPARSDAHAWSAHPTFDLLTLVAGVQPDAPGFQQVRIAPHLGTLKSLSAMLPHPKGIIQVKYCETGTNLRAHIVLPAGLSGSFEWKGNTVALHEGSQKLLLIKKKQR